MRIKHKRAYSISNMETSPIKEYLKKILEDDERGAVESLEGTVSNLIDFMAKMIESLRKAGSINNQSIIELLGHHRYESLEIIDD